MKKFTLILAVMLLVSPLLFSGGQRGQPARQGPGEIPDYINLDGYFPVVKSGTSVNMTVSWLPHGIYAQHSDPDQIWFFRFVREAMNINLNVTARPAGPEVKNLMFASGDLPDIWFEGLTPNDIVNYGVAEKMIIPISDYLSPELMPNLYRAYQSDPGLKSPSTASDGKVYGFSTLKGREWLHGPITGGLSRAFYNQRWLDQLGLRIPETLDEYMAVLRAFKTLGADVLPDAGIFNGQNNFPLIFSALGFHWTYGNPLTNVGTRNGNVTFVYGDRDIYPKFLEIYKTMYDEGLITRDFFTMDNNTRVALTQSGIGGVIPFNLVTMVGSTRCFDYVSAKPLTSEFSREVYWMSPPNHVVINQAAVMSGNRYPEAAMRMFDYFYTEETGLIGFYGFPHTEPAYQYGMLRGWTITNNRIDVQIDNPALYDSEMFFSNSRIRPIHDMVGIQNNIDSIAMRMYGLNPPAEEFNRSIPDGFMRGTTHDHLSPHIVTSFPYVVYWDEVSARRITDLSAVLDDYANTQFAQFVTGARPISDLPRYFDELNRMGYQEYLKYFVDYYEGVRADR